MAVLGVWGCGSGARSGAHVTTGGASGTGDAAGQGPVGPNLDGMRGVTGGTSSLGGGGSAGVGGLGGTAGTGGAGSSGSAGSAGSPMTIEYSAIWGASKTDVWSGDTRGHLSHYDGNNWSDPITVPGLDAVHGLWGASSTDIYAISGSSAFHYDGKSWTDMQPPNHSLFLEALSGTSSTNVWFAGFNGLVLVWDGKTWSERSLAAAAGEPAAEDFDSLSVLSPTEAWGTAGFVAPKLYHYAAGWTEVSSVGGEGAVYAVGSDVWWGRCHMNGAAADCPADLSSTIGAIWGLGAKDIWAVSQDALYHYDGAWSTILQLKYDAFLGDVWSSGEGAWIAGAGLREHHP